jgi:hypothetical protein
MHPRDSINLMPLLEILKFWRVSPSLKSLWGGIRPSLDSRCKWLGWKPTPFTHVFTALKFKHGPFSIYGPKHKTRNHLHHILVFLWTLFDLVYDNVRIFFFFIKYWSYIMHNMHSYSYHIKINKYCKITLSKFMILKIKNNSKPHI